MPIFVFINAETKPEETSESQTTDQKNHTPVSSKRQGSQPETAKEDTRVEEGELGG